MILVTGGAGFIGSNFVLQWMREEGEPIINLDKLTYAGNLQNLEALRHDDRHIFAHGDICDREFVDSLIRIHRPRAVIHFAAESHVDRSILGPEEFVRTNINGTFVLLEAFKRYWETLEGDEKTAFRFLHVSTDEVYGSLDPQDPAFTEKTAYAPNSPYSASKAASDHLVRAYHHTYDLPTLTTNCSNNYGPYQFPEKLIPLMIINALADKSLPIYGDGRNVRDWLYVGDHCTGIRAALNSGNPGETYNIGGCNEYANIDVVHLLCDLLDEMKPRADKMSYRNKIVYVKDRAGHDRRYAIDARKAKAELNWQPSESFETGLRKTVQWYLDNQAWVQSVQSGSYTEWYERNYGSRGER